LRDGLERADKKGFRMSIIPLTVLLGHYWTCFSRDKNEAAQEFDSVIGDCGSRVAHRVFSTLLMSIGETADTVRFIHG
jgi:hypothetical protein